jgi:hypothetical protein
MKQSLRMFVLVLLALAAAASVIYLQHRFDEGDRKAALRIVEEYKAPTSKKSIPEIVRARHPNGSIVFSATTESSCFQHIRVTCIVQEQDPKGVVQSYEYRFLIDINTRHIAPGNQLSEGILAELDKPPSFSATSASASTAASVSALPSPSVGTSGSPAPSGSASAVPAQ